MTVLITIIGKHIYLRLFQTAHPGADGAAAEEPANRQSRCVCFSVFDNVYLVNGNLSCLRLLQCLCVFRVKKKKINIPSLFCLLMYLPLMEVQLVLLYC